MNIGESYTSNQKYTPEFKEEAVRQIIERSRSVSDIAERLGVSSHSLYNWVKAVKPGKNEQQAQERLDAKKRFFPSKPNCVEQKKKEIS